MRSCAFRCTSPVAPPWRRHTDPPRIAKRLHGLPSRCLPAAQRRGWLRRCQFRCFSTWPLIDGRLRASTFEHHDAVEYLLVRLGRSHFYFVSGFGPSPAQSSASRIAANLIESATLSSVAIFSSSHANRSAASSSRCLALPLPRGRRRHDKRIPTTVNRRVCICPGSCGARCNDVPAPRVWRWPTTVRST